MILLSSLPCFMVSGILWSTVRKCLTFIPVSVSLSSLNTWNFLSVESKEGIFRYVIEVTLEPHLRMSAGCQWSQPSNWRLRIFSRHLTSWKGRGAGCGINHRWFHQSYFCNEASMKPKGQGSESFWVVNPWRCWENGALERAWKLQTLFPYVSRTCL